MRNIDEHHTQKQIKNILVNCWDNDDVANDNDNCCCLQLAKLCEVVPVVVSTTIVFNLDMILCIFPYGDLLITHLRSFKIVQCTIAHKWFRFYKWAMSAMSNRQQ